MTSVTRALRTGNAQDWRERMVSLTPYGGLVALLIVFSASSPVFLTVPNFQEIIRQAAILVLIALAETFVVLIGCIDLSVGTIVSFTGLSAAYLISKDVNELIVVAIVMIMGMVIGLTNGVIYRYGRVPSFISTLGMSFVLQGLMQELYGPVPIVLGAPALTAAVNGMFLGIVPNVGIIAVLLLVLSIVLARGTAVGRYMYAIGGNERVAELSGIQVGVVKLVTFTVAGLLCGAASVLLAVRIDSGTATMGSGFLLPAIAAVVIGGTPLTGGIGGPARTVLGVLLLGVLLNGMTLLSVGPFTQLIIQGAVVIGAVVLAAARTPDAIVK
jgi:ribose/xylose/arabinose/galactoside ABC-type transport system permease subunit